ncbi:MAG: Trm112 family protein [Acidobacteria bacterium]|uniref:UPF0434 protein IFK94_14380 n=1 Tax=Candidatus Polarisedimenticola svalbardensis TaxID=2886004 RepID=A0A8J6Y4J5_9BACT|nr:Trm112 family protein [Candidatus Polarisedimenticola svalbardensis]
MNLDPKLIEILACPGCHGRFRQLRQPDRLECIECGRRYPVRDGIPILLLEQAEDPAKNDT